MCWPAKPTEKQLLLSHRLGKLTASSAACNVSHVGPARQRLEPAQFLLNPLRSSTTTCPTTKKLQPQESTGGCDAVAASCQFESRNFLIKTGNSNSTHACGRRLSSLQQIASPAGAGIVAQLFDLETFECQIRSTITALAGQT